ncbi:MAG TPA: HAD-IA family hydrolase [Longimicrobiales bacterium]|nr:HAD-IA family hydrolase [Longimicrobiales bacterium]
MKPPWAAVLFDLDGTLADTIELILHCFRHTMRTHRDEVPPDAIWLAGLGIPLRQQLRDLARSEEEGAAMLETYVAFQRTVHDDMVSPFPGASELLSELRAGGAAIGVVTSKRSGLARRTLACCGLDGTFDVLVGADDVARAKPDPEPVRLALSRLGLHGRESEVLFVGDSPHDVRAGRAAGTYTAAALWGPFGQALSEGREADFYVERLADVLALRPLPSPGR